MVYLMTSTKRFGFRKPYLNVNRWFTTIINQPQVKSVIGDFKLCEKATEFDGKKYAEFQGKGGAGGKGSGAAKDKKEKKSSQQPKKDANKEKEAPEPEEEMDAAEEALAAEPKSKNPFETLPKG
jgi:elongation factor 1-gamma